MEIGIASSIRTIADLERAVRALCDYFETDAVVVVGSQAVLATIPNAPSAARTSLEIDAYLLDAKRWEQANGREASEEINALFGYLSVFHETHGFYIDGVDETTASLPADWLDRSHRIPVECHGRQVHVITPDIHDLASSKLCRMDPKDMAFVKALHTAGELNISVLEQQVKRIATAPEVRNRALTFLAGLRSQMG